MAVRSAQAGPQSGLWVAILLFLAALAFRVWGLSFGLPHSFSGDEINKRDAALSLADNGFIHTDRQPSFIYNSLFAIYTVAQAVKSDWTPAEYVYLGRLWMAVLGALTVVAVWRLGSLVNRDTGLAAAALLAVLPLHTACSRYIKEDAPLSLMATLTVLAGFVYLRAPTRLHVVLMGLAIGFSASTKYTGAILLLPAVAALAYSSIGTKRPLMEPCIDLSVLLGSAALGFFVLSPIYLLHPRLLIDGLLYQGEYALAGHDGIVIGPWPEWWTYYLRTGLAPGMTWPALVMALAGLVLLVRVPGGWIVTSSAIWLYVVLESALAKPAPFSARYLMPLLPLLSVAAGFSLAALCRQMTRWTSRAVAYGVCGLVLIAPPLTMSILIVLEAVDDTRLVAGKWMEAHIPDGSTIVVAESFENLPATAFWQTRWRVDNRDDTKLRVSWDGAEPPYFVVSSFRYQRFLDSPASVPERTAYYRTVMNEFDLVKAFQARWLTYGKHSPTILIYRPSSRTTRAMREKVQP